MKKGIHPEYRFVVFRDELADFAFLTRSTVKTEDKIVWEDGKEYPLVKLDLSSASHPFFTGKEKLVDTAGRIDRFKRKFGNKINIKSQKKVKVKKTKEEKKTGTQGAAKSE